MVCTGHGEKYRRRLLPWGWAHEPGPPPGAEVCRSQPVTVPGHLGMGDASTTLSGSWGPASDPVPAWHGGLSHVMSGIPGSSLCPLSAPLSSGPLTAEARTRRWGRRAVSRPAYAAAILSLRPGPGTRASRAFVQEGLERVPTA